MVPLLGVISCVEGNEPGSHGGLVALVSRPVIAGMREDVQDGWKPTETVYRLIGNESVARGFHYICTWSPGHGCRAVQCTAFNISMVGINCVGTFSLL